MARGFAAAAASLVFADLNDRVHELAAKFRDAGANFHSLVFDVTDEAAIAGAFKQIMQRYSRIDVVVNNADVIVRTPLLRLTRLKWQKLIDTDLTACFFWWPSKPCIMVKQGSGRVINMGSIMNHVSRPNLVP